MKYADIMREIFDDDKVSAEITINEAAVKILDTNRSLLFVFSPHHKSFEGVLTKENILTAHTQGATVDSAIKKFLLKDYKVLYKNDNCRLDKIQKNIIYLVYDKDNKICGWLNKDIANEKMINLMDNEIKQTWMQLPLKKYKCISEDIRKSTVETINLFNDIKTNLKQLWEILEYSADSIFVTDGNGDVIYCNPSFLSSINHENDKDIINKNINELQRQEIILFEPVVTPIVLSTKKKTTLKTKSTKTGGSNGSKWWIVTGTPVFDDDKIKMVITNAKNFGELKALTNYLEKNTQISANETDETINNVVCQGKHMRKIMSMAKNVAKFDTTVLITGESGVGKGVIARYIHNCSERKNEKLVEINCSAIPESLFESELFGYEPGAFTGSRSKGKAGIIETAHKGTLILDEIGDMSLTFQPKLLKVIQDKKLQRVGGLEEKCIDVRIIATTNQPLMEMVEKNFFEKIYIIG